MSVDEDLFRALDGPRRAGWAKYYAEHDRAELLLRDVKRLWNVLRIVSDMLLRYIAEDCGSDPRAIEDYLRYLERGWGTDLMDIVEEARRWKADRVSWTVQIDRGFIEWVRQERAKALARREAEAGL